MSDIKVQNTGDLLGYLVSEGGDLQIVRGQDYLVQSIEQALRLLRGDWIPNQTLGIDYFNLLEKGVDFQILLAEIREAVLSVEDVTSVEVSGLDFVADTRTMNIGLIINGTLDVPVEVVL